MRRLALLTAGALLAAPAWAKSAEPVVVELFTSQGCSGCPQANELVMKLADDPEVIVLTWPVDYWDYLGWKDTFARPEFSKRQQAYKAAFKLRDVYTPQLVLDGERQMAGVKAEDVQAAVQQQAAERVYPPDMMFMGGDRVAVGSGKVPKGGAQVWLVRYDPDVREVAVKKGENKGQTVRQANTVRELVRLGDWRGKPRVFRLPKTVDGSLKTVVLVQSARTGRIVAAERL